MKTFIGIEIGDSAYTEFKMKNDEFKQTEDGVLVGRVEAETEVSALNKIKSLDWNKNRVFDHVILLEVKNK